jgi:Zn-dependent M28 family amino/carboxypeptidase
VTLGGRRVPVDRPQARAVDGHEAPLTSYLHFAADDMLTLVVMERMLAGVAMRRHTGTAEPVGTQVEKAAKPTSRSLAAYLRGAGKSAQDNCFDGRSDFDGFTLAGVPAGGLFSGTDKQMSDEQANLWGGTAGEPFDPNYHKSTDTLEHVGSTAMDINGGGVAYAVGRTRSTFAAAMACRSVSTKHPALG